MFFIIKLTQMYLRTFVEGTFVPSYLRTKTAINFMISEDGDRNSHSVKFA